MGNAEGTSGKKHANVEGGAQGREAEALRGVGRGWDGVGRGEG